MSWVRFLMVVAALGAWTGSALAGEPPAAAGDAPPSDGAPAVAAKAAKPAGDWQHTPIDSALAGRPLDVSVRMGVMKGVKVTLHYRGAGEPEFTEVVMVRSGANKVGRIP